MSIGNGPENYGVYLGSDGITHMHKSGTSTVWSAFRRLTDHSALLNLIYMRRHYLVSGTGSTEEEPAGATPTAEPAPENAVAEAGAASGGSITSRPSSTSVTCSVGTPLSSTSLYLPTFTPSRPSRVGSSVTVTNSGSNAAVELLRQLRRAGRVVLHPLFIKPGIPRENGRNESFNGKLTGEFLNREVLTSEREAKVLVKEWLRECNPVRPLSSLGC